MRWTAALSVVLVAGAATAQNPNNENDLPLTTGTDTLVALSDPSVGFPTGTNPPDLANGDTFWKVYPREVMRYGGAQTMEISGMQLELFDTDWSTPPAFYDMVLTRGVDSGAPGGSGVNPGNIEPDFTDPAAVFVSLGTSGLPDPCVANPGLCPGGCPPGGQAVGYTIDVQIGTGNGDGIIVPADGQQDLVVSAFAPGGMTLSGGACGSGDYTLMYALSTTAGTGFGEGQPDWLGTGYSAYGGVRTGGFPPAQPLADLVPDTAALILEFFEPTAIVAWNDGTLAAPDDGLAGLHPPVAGGSATVTLRLYDWAGIGRQGIFFASLTPPLPGAGAALPGGSFLKLDILDPLVQFLLAFPNVLPGGPVVLQSNGGVPFDNGIFEAGPLPAPQSYAGTTVHVQGFVLGPGAGGGVSVSSTNVFTTTFF